MSDHFEKHVQIAKADADRRVVIGVAMEPNRVDTQGDYERPDTIESLSEGFMERLAGGDAKSGVMHATFPSGNVLSHIENRVLSAPEKIGDTEYPAGTWVIGKKVRDDTLWSLIENQTLTGFSIGGHIHDGEMRAVDDLPDGVTIDDDLQEAAGETGVREITDATIHEISLVDYPAVQRAQIQTAKGDDLAKAANELTESVDVATEYLVEERGHDPDPARELAAFLNREKTAGNDGSWLTRVKKVFSRDDDGVRQSTRTDEKAGRTLSGDNVQSAMAVHDASLDLLGRSDVEHGRWRFSDDPAVDFDIGGYGQQKSTSDERAESRVGSDSVDNMDTNELRDLIGEVVDEKMGQDEQTEETADEEPSDLDEIKSMIADLQTDEKEDEEKADESDDLGEIKEMLSQMASAQGVSQQADNGQAGTEKTWEKSPFGKGGDR
jgi:hypothetical protein